MYAVLYMLCVRRAHNSYDEGIEGLDDFGRVHAVHLYFVGSEISCFNYLQKVVREMNRLGMLVDISHVNNQTMLDVLETSVAPGEES